MFTSKKEVTSKGHVTKWVTSEKSHFGKESLWKRLTSKLITSSIGHFEYNSVRKSLINLKSSFKWTIRRSGPLSKWLNLTTNVFRSNLFSILLISTWTTCRSDLFPSDRSSFLNDSETFYISLLTMPEYLQDRHRVTDSDSQRRAMISPSSRLRKPDNTTRSVSAILSGSLPHLLQKILKIKFETLHYFLFFVR